MGHSLRKYARDSTKEAEKTQYEIEEEIGLTIVGRLSGGGTKICSLVLPQSKLFALYKLLYDELSR